MPNAVELLDRKCQSPAARTSDRATGSVDRRWDYVAKGKPVFQPGEPRRLYRIESGAVCHFSQWAGARFEIIECAFAGDIIGLGYLSTHSSIATAMADTMVSIVTPEEFEQSLRGDDHLAFRLAGAGEREFDYLRNKSLQAALLPPLQRVAHFLLAIANINGTEGCEGRVIVDDVTSGFVARQLHMTIDTMTMALLSLRQSGLIDVTAKGLHIVDVAGMEAVAASA
ncbi:MAG: Crp/Fnr family transcriptional regulator [Hyphomicrobium sp.]